MAFRDFLSPGDIHYTIDIVNRKRDMYEITYGEPPHYIKMPSMIFRFFSEVKPFRDVQEMNGMHIIRVYTTVDEITDKIQSKLGEEAEKFADCQWYPIDIKVNEADLSIDFTLTAIKKVVNTGE